MSVAEHTSESLTDDEVWALAISRCEKAERNYWRMALVFAGIALAAPMLGLHGFSWGMAVAFGGCALIIKLDVQYWRVIGFAPTISYWRRVADLAPQFAAVGVSGAGLFIVTDALQRPGAIEEVFVLSAMGVGAFIGFALALGLSFCVDMKTARRWLRLA
ncbi:MAG: hypothetical protein A4S17_12250 [Proteobacteria bacterium HN_bin10]|nr:MAG: hypothetical protein A4S17_12250 [Proteobacteria bacterium HN_bin10]